MSKRRHAPNDGDDDANGRTSSSSSSSSSKRPRRRRSTDGPTFAFAWNNEKFSDAKVKIFEDPEPEPDQPPRASSSSQRVQPKRKAKSDQRGLDVEVEDACEVLRVSKVALASYSSYFERLFDAGMMESNQSVVEIHVKAGRMAACKDTIRYVYMGEFEDHTPEHLLTVVMLADRFDLVSVAKAACRTLLNAAELPPSPENDDEKINGPSGDDDDDRDGIREWRRRDRLRGEVYEALLSLPEAVRDADWFKPTLRDVRQMLCNRYTSMQDMWTYRQTRHLGAQCLAIVLADDQLEVRDEESALFIALEWFEGLSEKRRADVDGINAVLDEVRFPAMSVQYLRTVARHCSFGDNVDVRSRVEAALDFHALPEDIKYSIKDGRIAISDRFRDPNLNCPRSRAYGRSPLIELDGFGHFKATNSNAIKAEGGAGAEFDLVTGVQLRSGMECSLGLKFSNRTLKPYRRGTVCYMKLQMPAGFSPGARAFFTTTDLDIALREQEPPFVDQVVKRGPTSSWMTWSIVDGRATARVRMFEFDRPANFDPTQLRLFGALSY